MLHVRATAVPGSIKGLRDAAADFAQNAGADTDVVRSVRVAVSEVLSNAVVHAYAEAPSPGPMELKAWLREGDLIVVVCDEGGGMRPRPNSPGLGLGMPMVAQLANDLRVADRESGGTQVAMRFQLRGAAVV